jgi:hypothetical protein
MIKSIWRNDRTFHQALLAQTGFLVFANVSHMDDRMVHWQLVVFTYIWVKAHDVYILNSLDFPDLIV